MPPRMPDRRLLVVGGGARPDAGPDDPPGNGQAIARVAAREGSTVCIADAWPEAAEEAVKLIEAEREGASVAPVIADVSKPEDCERLVAEANERLGGIDALVLNVGIGAGLGLEGTSQEDWDLVLSVNLRAHFLVAKHTLPLMASGSILFIGSLAGLRPGSFIPSYDSSKAALLGLCRHVALEGSRKGVRANLLAPGLIDTPLGRLAGQMRPGRAKTPIPLGRQGTAWEVAHAAVFLLSDEASYVTGQTLAVDGGLGNLVSGP